MPQTYISVACGIIEREGKILAAQRGVNMHHPGKWEFPGGKQEPYESLEACLHRELWEELRITVERVHAFPGLKHVYGEKAIELFAFHVLWQEGEPQLIEHQQIRWVPPSALPNLDWAEADSRLVSLWLNHRRLDA